MSVVQAPTWSPGNSTWGPGNAFIFTASNEGDVDIFSAHPNFGLQMSRIRAPKARWLVVSFLAFRSISPQMDPCEKFSESSETVCQSIPTFAFMPDGL
ncbi:hypothetical protein OIU76_003104 [Salix suchowensis]|nr:hypothetical protein OIU76_003104 [Salix suchowensis]